MRIKHRRPTIGEILARIKTLEEIRTFWIKRTLDNPEDPDAQRELCTTLSLINELQALISPW